MRDFVIFADSVCDLDRETREALGVEYIPMRYMIDDVEYVASLDWEFHSVKEYYDLLREGKRVFTAQVPKNDYEAAFRAAAEAGKDVVYIACSSALSSSVNTAALVAQEMKETHPDAEVYCIDSLISSLGQGFMIMEASRLRREGKSAAETAAYITSIRLSVNQCGTVASMEYLRRAGRVKASKAFFGNLFGVKPLIISDRKGQNYAYKKVKGTVNARAAIAQHMVDAADGNYDLLLLSHADCPEEAEALKEAIFAIQPFKEVKMGVIGPIVGCSVGPGTVIAFCLGKEVMIEGNE